ncbi:sulfatase [Bacteroidota bacterium]
MKKLPLMLLALLIFAGGCILKESQAPPNIIYVMTDQQAFDAMSCSGNHLVRTPALDALARDGVRFTEAYCAYPLCVPSRAAMFSGRMPHEAGIFVNTRTIKDEEFPFPILAQSMVSAGYKTHYIGKWHLTIPRQDTLKHGFQTIELPGSHGFDSVYAWLAGEFLREDHDRPFFLTVSFVNPHDCCQLARGEDLSGFEGNIPPLPGAEDLPALPDNFEIPENEPDFIREWQAINSERVHRSHFWNELDFREYQWGYYRLVEKVDSLLGQVFEAAYASRYADNTIIIFSSDHGDGISRHHWNQKWSTYDESSKVPFIVAGNPVARKGETDSRLVSAGLDLFPTICDYAGVTPPDGMRGRSIRPLLEGTLEGEWRKYVVTELSFGNWVDEYHQDTFPKARMLRTDGFKYVVLDKGENREQLVDMKNDPGEMKNLAMDAEYEMILEEHRNYLNEWLQATNDSFKPVD